MVFLDLSFLSSDISLMNIKIRNYNTIVFFLSIVTMNEADSPQQKANQIWQWLYNISELINIGGLLFYYYILI
jgi:hypothetical protein